MKALNNKTAVKAVRPERIIQLVKAISFVRSLTGLSRI